MKFCSLSHTVRLFGTGLLLTLALIPACAGREAPHLPLAANEPASDPSLASVPLSLPTPVQEPVPAHEPAPVQEPVPVQEQSPTYRETGMAAWYGKELHGKHTANGEVFDMYGLSAAHRTLPLGTVVRVTNLDNFKSITVRINDRGPFLKGRFLDLSYGAAKELDFVSQGVARIKLETVEAVRNRAQYTVQAAVFTEEESARMLKERLEAKFSAVSIVFFESNISRFYRVRVGAFASEDRAEQVAGKLLLEGLEPVVIRKD